MLYEDKFGRLLTEEDLDLMNEMDIEERGIHVYGEGFGEI